jgi:hypothetical protein
MAGAATVAAAVAGAGSAGAAVTRTGSAGTAVAEAGMLLAASMEAGAPGSDAAARRITASMTPATVATMPTVAATVNCSWSSATESTAITPP